MQLLTTHNRRNPRSVVGPSEPADVLACCPSCRTVYPDGRPGQQVLCRCDKTVNLIAAVVHCGHCGDDTSPRTDGKPTHCVGCGRVLD